MLSVTSAYLPKDWWSYLGLQHLLGWLVLLLSSVCIPRAWQERSAKVNASRQSFGQRWWFGGRHARAKRREGLLNKNPILWLAARGQWLPLLVWVATVLSLALFVWKLIYHVKNGFYWFGNLEQTLQILIRLVFFFWVASQASRFFVDATRNGAMELILVTPTTPAQIVKGQWLALRRTFLIPGLLLLLISVTSHWIELHALLKNMPVGPLGKMPGSFNMIHIKIVGMIGRHSYIRGEPFAVAWFGMWMGMTTRKPSIAVLKTLCFVVVLPWLALIFIQGVTMIVTMLPKWNGFWPFWTATVLVSLLSVAKSIAFIYWSRRRLADRFRHQAANEGRTSSNLTVPPSLPPIAPPPVPPTEGTPSEPNGKDAPAIISAPPFAIR